MLRYSSARWGPATTRTPGCSPLHPATPASLVWSAEVQDGGQLQVGLQKSQWTAVPLHPASLSSLVRAAVVQDEDLLQLGHQTSHRTAAPLHPDTRCSQAV